MRANLVVTPAHLLLGLLSDPASSAVAALTAQGIAIDAVASAARAALPPPTAQPPALVPYDDAAKAVIETCVAEADTMGDARVGGLHLLLALTTNEGEDGVLRHVGFDANAARGTAGQDGTA